MEQKAKHVEEITIEPLTRIEGHLAIHAKADKIRRRYIDAQSYGTMFRGFEIILKDREPADAIWITQRICGVCPVPHGIASVETVDMCYNASPPPLGTALRNLTLIAEELYDSPLGCAILEGPDYSDGILKKYNTDVWKDAKNTKAEHSDIHGYKTIGDICKALTPITGSLWLKALDISKLGRKMASLIAGKHPHVNSLVPGGIGKSISATDIEQYYSMLSHHIAFTKEFVSAFNDIIDFMQIYFSEIGVRNANLMSFGCYEDIESYNCNYSDMNGWGIKRAITPGVIINGKILTNDLIEINLGVREFVEHSYYDGWNSIEIESDPVGNKVDKNHPWNEKTIPRPGRAKDWNGKYTWLKTPRFEYKGNVYSVEVGPLARMYLTAKSKKIPESTGKSMKFTLPRANIAGHNMIDEMEFEWRIPEKINTLERIRARAYFHAYSAYVAYNQVLEALNAIRDGKTSVWSRYSKPREGIGVGLNEAMRGSVAHWCIMKNGKIYRYQVIAPTTWNASPKDKYGNHGAYEEAIIGTPITESDRFDGIDVVRVVRSFDPCLACAVHIYDLRNKTMTPMTRKVTPNIVR